MRFAIFRLTGAMSPMAFFFERTPIFEPPYSLYMWDNTESSPEPEPRPDPDRTLCYIIRPCGWLENVTRSPLNRRGWVVQERLLAPRVLHFSPRQVSWECGQKFACEQTPMGLIGSESGNNPGTYGLDGCAEACVAMRRLKLNEPEAAVDWPRLVKQYTSCGLTRQSDRLVAVAGVAKVLASTIGDQYVAGIWMTTLPKALGWRRIKKQLCSHTTQYYTPSFSWAAAEGEVGFPIRGIVDRMSATFVKHREKTASPSTDLSGQTFTDHVFGPLISPEVEVRMQGMLRSCRRVPLQLVPVNWSKPNDFNAYAYPSTNIEDSVVDPCFENGTTFCVTYDRAFDGDEKADAIMYYYTIISYFPSNSHGPSASNAYEGVEGVLLKSVDASMGRFQRVGHVFQWHGQSHGPDIRLPLGNERQLPAWSYDATTGQHTFYIV